MLFLILIVLTFFSLVFNGYMIYAPNKVIFNFVPRIAKISSLIIVLGNIALIILQCYCYLYPEKDVSNTIAVLLLTAIALFSTIFIVINEQYHSYKGEVGKIADNLLKRDFTATKPFEKLTTDLTQFKVCDEKVYLSPVMDLCNREIVAYSISLSPNLQQIRDMLNKLFDKLPNDARPIFHSDQGWQYQHTEYQRLLSEHNITQSMSRKGNCMDNGAMENFFGRLKVKMHYGEKFQTVDEFINCLEEYIAYYNNERIVSKCAVRY